MTEERATRHWLVKSDPEEFSWKDLWSARGRRTAWDGVRNYQARNFLRDAMAPGDGVLFYHSSSDPPAVVGLAEVASAARPDPTQFDARHPHYDPKSASDAPRWYLVDLRAVRALPEPVPLDALKRDPRLARMLVVQRGQRLSVQPVTEAEWGAVLELGGAAG